jgi:hypothetical protein
MRNIHDVIREKEALLARVNDELAALRVALRLLTDAADQSSAFPTNDQRSATAHEEPARVQAGRVKNFP